MMRIATIVALFAVSATSAEYDGTSWTEVADVSAPRSYSICSGSVTEGFSAGGSPGGLAVTEEWADPNFSTVTFTAS